MGAVFNERPNHDAADRDSATVHDLRLRFSKGVHEAKRRKRKPARQKSQRHKRSDTKHHDCEVVRNGGKGVSGFRRVSEAAVLELLKKKHRGINRNNGPQSPGCPQANRAVLLFF